MRGLDPLRAGRTFSLGRRDCLERQPSGGPVDYIDISFGPYWDVARAAVWRTSPTLARCRVDARLPAVVWGDPGPLLAASGSEDLAQHHVQPEFRPMPPVELGRLVRESETAASMRVALPGRIEPCTFGGSARSLPVVFRRRPSEAPRECPVSGIQSGPSEPLTRWLVGIDGIGVGLVTRSAEIIRRRCRAPFRKPGASLPSIRRQYE
jgi:hypothetical protein